MMKTITPLRSEGDFRLRDGSFVHLRPIQSDDTGRLQAFHTHLSMNTIVLRFGSYMPILNEEMDEQFTHLDHRHAMAFVATIRQGTDEMIVGVGRYSWIAPATAEIAFTIADQWQGRGIATSLLYLLAWYGREHGFTTFVGYTMEENATMRNVFRKSGIPTTFQRDVHDHHTLVATLDIMHLDAACMPMLS
jgi:RimJ/RimL family protein N-acetyltransferase